MFDSPFMSCPVCNAVVLLDQTQRECAAEHHCSDSRPCPLERYFTGHDFSTTSNNKKAPDDKLAGTS